MVNVVDILGSEWIGWANSIFLLEALGLLLLLWIGLAALQRQKIKRSLPTTLSMKDWRSFKREHLARKLAAHDTSATTSIPQQLRALSRAIASGHFHHLILFTPPASGRTWLLLQALQHLRWRRVKMISLQSEQALKSLTKIDNPSATWLLIDDVESYRPELQARERLEAILEATEAFKAVIMVAQPSRWPDSWQRRDQLGRIKLVGEDHFCWATTAALLPWTADEARSWLRKHSSTGQRPALQRLEKGLDWRNPLWSRPVVLNMLAYSAGTKGVFHYLFQAVESSLQVAAGSSDPDLAWAEWQELATDARPGAIDHVHPALAPIASQQADGVVRFRHQLYKAYFLAKQAWIKEDKGSVQQMRTFPEARILYMELAWSRYLEEAGPEPGWAISPETGAKTALRELTPDEVANVEFLELMQFRGPDLRFLGQMKRLKRIWLTHAGADDRFVIMRSWKPGHGARLWLHGVGGWQHHSVYGEKKYWKEIPSLPDIHPSRLLTPSFIRIDNNPFRQLLRLDPNKLPNPLCKELLTSDRDQKSYATAYELNLPAGEFELFDKVYIYVFASGEVQLQYLHTRPTKNLLPLLTSMLERWALYYGPDDSGLRELSLVEKTDIRQGAWQGRQWAQTNQDRYERPVLIQLTKPEQLELWIFNGKTESV